MNAGGEDVSLDVEAGDGTEKAGVIDFGGIDRCDPLARFGDSETFGGDLVEDFWEPGFEFGRGDGLHDVILIGRSDSGVVGV